MLPSSINKPEYYIDNSSVFNPNTIESILSVSENEQLEQSSLISSEPNNNNEQSEQSEQSDDFSRARPGFLNWLNTDLDCFKENNNYHTIIICPYVINREGKLPFLQFGFIQNSNTINFIKLPKSVLNSLDNLNGCSGFIEQNNNMYLFYENTDLERIAYFLTQTCGFQWFLLVDEIYNKKCVCNIPINKDIFNFFQKNIDFLFLKKSAKYDAGWYDIPIVVYHGTHGDNTSFMATYGVGASENNMIMGPYYYFTDYFNGINQGIYPTKNHLSNPKFCDLMTQDKKYKKCSLCRFALFLGKTQVSMNHPDDLIDTSVMKSSLLSDTNSEIKGNEILTMRLTDYDGNWTKKYDSVYIGKIILDDGSLLPQTPIWVVKDYSQQLFLTMHIIDKKTNNIV